MWKGLFARPTNERAQQPYFTQFTAASFARFRRLAQIALPLFVVTAVYDLFRFAAWGVGWLVWLEIAILAMIVLAIGADAYGRGRNDPFAERNLARLTLLFLLLNALVQAGFDVILAQDGGYGRCWFAGCTWPPLASGLAAPCGTSSSPYRRRGALSPCRLLSPPVSSWSGLG